MKKFSKNAKRIIFFGAPGSGKGTQSEFLKSRGFCHLSTGDILREILKNPNHQLFQEISVCIKSGNLVGDDIINSMMALKIEEVMSSNIILDGYPRTLEQARFLESVMVKIGEQIDHVFFFNIDENLVLERLLSRRVCGGCKSVFSSGDICKNCGEILRKRDDDNKQTILSRMKIFNETVTPLLDFYKNITINIDASKSVDIIFSEISKSLGM